MATSPPQSLKIEIFGHQNTAPSRHFDLKLRQHSRRAISSFLCPSLATHRIGSLGNAAASNSIQRHVSCYGPTASCPIHIYLICGR
mmetsp:Transcript_25770/g.46691  ORF Transcript_25770/g.46691 Transcript_25770/m.46691 type:complete len:86 (-) Transcript_25770:17-274(-)